MGQGSKPWAGAVVAGVCVTWAGCAHRAVEGPRVVEQVSTEFSVRASHAERFGLVGSPSQSPSPEEPPAGRLGWRTPAGWTELPASSMRVANFRPRGNEGAECYLTLLAGDAGGTAANVNRWRSQLALGPLSADAIDALPRVAFLGRQAALVEATGTWKGMSGGESKADWGLLGAVLVEPSGSAFLKMTGPAAIVAAEREAFLALAASFTDGAGAPSDSTASAGGFTFEIPDGWRRSGDKPSRALSFFAGEGEAVECYVTVLGGTAGGELANVNRWRSQLGLAPVDQAAVDALDPFSILDRPGRLVELEGDGAALCGITCMGEDHSVFVKMTGPAELVRKQRPAMLTFASSLREARR